METFTVTAASGWQTLSSLLATAGYSATPNVANSYLWSWLYVKDTHATQTVIVKVLPGATAPAADSGINLAAAGGNITLNPGHGFVDGKAIWIKASGNSTTIDVAFFRKASN